MFADMARVRKYRHNYLPPGVLITRVLLDLVLYECLRLQSQSRATVISALRTYTIPRLEAHSLPDSLQSSGSAARDSLLCTCAEQLATETIRRDCRFRIAP